MRSAGESVFVDTGAWIALAVVSDSYHAAARARWEALERIGTRLRTSVPVVVETFTYLDRRGSRELALRWRAALQTIPRFEVLECTPRDLEEAWVWFERRDLHKLSVVDATSFVLMRRHKIKRILGFDTHFAMAGFRLVQ